MLTKRLSACAERVTKGSVICDVGTDHAYLPTWLLQKKICPYAVLTDIHAGPLEAARRTLEEAGVLEQATLFLCDGLAQVSPNSVDEIVIAGMGGEMMVHILEEAPWVNQKHLILQPMTKSSSLRQWLAQMGFAWTETIACEQGHAAARFYSVLDIVYTGVPWTLSELEREVGLVDWSQAVSQLYAKWKRERVQQLAVRLKQAKQPTARWEMLAAELDQIIGGKKSC